MLKMLKLKKVSVYIPVKVYEKVDFPLKAYGCLF